jgi:hypothetical protein
MRFLWGMPRWKNENHMDENLGYTPWIGHLHKKTLVILGGFHKWGNRKWMASMENHLKIDDNWGYPHDLGNLHFNNRCGPWKLIFPQLIVNLIHNLKISFQDAL